MAVEQGATTLDDLEDAAEAGRAAAGAGAVGRPLLPRLPAYLSSMRLTHSFPIGPLRCHTLEAGLQHLDGGAMFGVVPRTLWTRRITPDDAEPDSARACAASSWSIPTAWC